MKIITDNIIFSLQKHGGISVVWHEFLKRLINDKKDFVCINTSNDANPLSLNDEIRPENKEYVHSGRYLNMVRYCASHIRKNYRYIFHSSYYRFCKDRNAINITTVHDFTYELYNKGLRKWIHSWQKRRAIRHSDYIICISENTKKDLLKFCPFVKEENVRVIYNGVSEDYFVTDEGCGNIIPYGKNEYVLFVGSRASYKNFGLTVEAVSKTGLNLVVVGAKLNEKEKAFAEMTLKDDKRLFCTGFIDNRSLNVLYNNAFALLYPSEYEGFGIPVLESQKAGCPVIAYNGSSIPEIIGDKTLLIDNIESGIEIIEKLKLIENPEIRNGIIERGIENANRYSWDKMYKEIMSLYESAWNNK